MQSCSKFGVGIELQESLLQSLKQLLVLKFRNLQNQKRMLLIILDLVQLQQKGGVSMKNKQTTIALAVYENQQ